MVLPPTKLRVVRRPKKAKPHPTPNHRSCGDAALPRTVISGSQDQGRRITCEAIVRRSHATVEALYLQEQMLFVAMSETAATVGASDT